MEANDASYERYLEDNYGPAVRSAEEIGNLADLDLTVDVHFEKANRAASQKWLDSAVESNPTIIGSFLREGSHSIFYRYAPFNIIARSSEGRLRVDALFEMTRRFRAFKILGRDEIFAFYQVLMRRTVHFPYFLLLGQKGFSLLHASMSCRGEDAVLFMGLNGAGKTTAALSLLPEMSIMADNFALFDGNRAFGFPEMLRIPANAVLDAGTKDGGRIVDGKTRVKMAGGSGNARFRPRACVIIKRGRINSWEETARDGAIEYLEAIDRFQHETDDFSYLTFIRDRSPPKVYPKCEYYVATVSDREGSRAMIRDKVGGLLGLRF